MSGQPAVLQVVILRDGLLVGTEVFVPGSYVLGSNPSSDLVLDDGGVAPEHAFLYFQNGKAAVQDAGSPSGLFVNGHRVNACEIRPVDEVVVGPFVLKVRILAQRPAQKEVHQPKAQRAPPAAAGVPAVAPMGSSQPRVTAPAQAQPAPPNPRGRSAKAASAPASPSAVRGGLPSAGGTVPSARRRNNLSVVPASNQASAAVQYEPEDEVTVAASVEDLEEVIRRPNPPPPAAREPAQRAPQKVAAPAQPTPRRAAPPVPAHAAPEPARRPTQEPARARDSGRESRREPAPAARDARQAPKEPSHSSLGPAARRVPHLFKLPKSGGPPRLYFELYWHGDRQLAKSFVLKKKPLLTSAAEDAPLSLYGFKVPAAPFQLAVRNGDAYRIYVPTHSKVERRGSSGDFAPVSTKDLDLDGTERCLTLSPGQSAKLSEGAMSLYAYVAPTPPMVKVSPLQGLPWLAIFFFLIFGSGLGSFIAFGPQPDDAPDFTAQKLAPVAVKLMLPEKKKKEEKPPPEKPKEQAKPEKKPEKRPEKVVKRAAKPPPPTPTPVVQAPPENAALKALKKMAAGPGTKDILAAMSKLGSGPGSKSNAFKLSGLLGKAPVALNGIGTGGLGGVGGGYGTKGAELLHGRGSGGIGALGVGSVGRGSVQGTVERASARAVSAQGTIDRDAVAKVINSHFQEVRACYERALFKEPGLAGKVSLEWSISTAGKVTSAKTKSSSLRNGSVEGCILSSLKTWQFPPAKGGVVLITYPFIFESKGF